MGRAQRLRAPTSLRKDAHNRTNATYRSRQEAVNPTSSNNTGVLYLTIVRCTIHTPTVQCITLRCVQSTELPQHHKEYSYVLARQPQIDSSAIRIIQSEFLPQLSRHTRPLSRTHTAKRRAHSSTNSSTSKPNEPIAVRVRVLAVQSSSTYTARTTGAFQHQLGKN